jgi:hypothetical protein
LAVHVDFDLGERQDTITIGVGRLEVSEAAVDELLQGELAVALPVGRLEILAGQTLEVPIIR